MAFIIAIIYSLIIIVFRKQVIGFFELGQASIERDAITYLVLSMGSNYFKIIGYSQVFMCIEIILGASFNGLGKHTYHL